MDIVAIIFLLSTPVAFVWCLWVCLPRGFFLIMPAPRCRFLKDPGARVSRSQEQATRDLVASIESLGFSQLGVRVEKPPLWAAGIRGFSLASAREQAFASIAVIRRQVVYYFYTPFNDGKVVLTANAAFPVMNGDQIRQSAIAASGPLDLLAAHHKLVEDFRSQGSVPYSDYTQDSRIRATYQYYKVDAVRRRMRWAGLSWLVVTILGCYPFVQTLIYMFD